MKIKTQNVKFGDCNLILSGEQSLLIDCGSLNRDDSGKLSSAKFAYSQIEEYIKNKKIKNLMISHFDKDHFNGILQIPDDYKFENTYLPYSIINNSVIYTHSIATLLAIAPTGSWGFKLSKQIVELFEKLIKISKKITFLKRNDIVNFDSKKIRILWPDVKCIDKFIDISNKGYSTNRDNMLPIVYELGLNVTIENFCESFNRFINNISETNNSLQIEDNIFSSMKDSFEKLIQDGETFKHTHFFEENPKIIKSFYYEKYHDLIKCMNAISLICDCEERFVFLGDAPPEIIDFIKSDFEKSYKIVKIQHHATSRYYTKATPIGEKYIISNGGYSNRKIDERFFNHSSVFVCTQNKAKEHFCKKYDSCIDCTKNCIYCKTSNIC